MALSIIDAAPNAPGGGRLTNPIAGQPCFLGLAWGPGAGAAVAVQLVIPSATIDTTYALDGFQANVNIAPYQGFYAGWHPDNIPVWLNSQQVAYGLWKVTFPSATSYVIMLGGAQITMTAVAAPNAPVKPMIGLIDQHSLGEMNAKLVSLSFSGTYAPGGFSLTGDDLGLYPPLFGQIEPTPTLMFAYDAPNRLLHVYNSSGEVSGATSFSTVGLFHGITN